MLLEINALDDQPIYEQLRRQIILGIASGRLRAGDGLPSVRRLGADLGVNLHTVNKAYNSLCGEGYLAMDRRKGAVVAGSPPPDESFMDNLSRRTGDIAAEAVCHGLDEESFLRFCARCYRNVCDVQSEKGGAAT